MCSYPITKETEGNDWTTEEFLGIEMRTQTRFRGAVIEVHHCHICPTLLSALYHSQSIMRQRSYVYMQLCKSDLWAIVTDRNQSHLSAYDHLYVCASRMGHIGEVCLKLLIQCYYEVGYGVHVRIDVARLLTTTIVI